MNAFTKEELTYEFAKRDLLIILYALERMIDPPCEMIDLYLLRNKVQLLINNDPWDTRNIAKMHLAEAESLIGHAMNLLGFKNENDE